jgi:hypothetical protein
MFQLFNLDSEANAQQATIRFTGFDWWWTIDYRRVG